MDEVDKQSRRVDSPAFTPESTVGPFFPGIFVHQMPQNLARIAPSLAHRPQGQPISLSGRVLDEAGLPVEHAILEFWQANAAGRYRHPLDQSERPLDPHFEGFARVCTDATGEFRFLTIKPGAHRISPQRTQRNAKEIQRAPHLRLTLFASGVDRLYTHTFFSDEALNEADPLLTSVDAAVRARLIAQKLTDMESDIVSYRLDIHLRGERETPFFDHWRSR
ncbi:MAG: protocatechuate 3,4-dioxygenase subunit alpha [Terriglobales bacterium]